MVGKGLTQIGRQTDRQAYKQNELLLISNKTRQQPSRKMDTGYEKAVYRKHNTNNFLTYEKMFNIIYN